MILCTSMICLFVRLHFWLRLFWVTVRPTFGNTIFSSLVGLFQHLHGHYLSLLILFQIEEDISSLSCTNTIFLQLAVKLQFFTICIRLETEAAILFFHGRLDWDVRQVRILCTFYSMRFQTFIWDCVLSLLSLRFASLGSALLICLIQGDTGSRSEVNL